MRCNLIKVYVYVNQIIERSKVSIKKDFASKLDWQSHALLNKNAIYTKGVTKKNELFMLYNIYKHSIQ